LRTGNENRRYEIVNLLGPGSASKAGTLAEVRKLNLGPLIMWLRHLLSLGGKKVLAPVADIGFSGVKSQEREMR